MCPQASVALSHVEARHRQSVAKLKREFPHAAPLELMGGDRICDKPNDGSGDLGDGRHNRRKRRQCSGRG